jgi:gluconate 5-dehydrogenase
MDGNGQLFDVSGKVALVSGSSRGLGLCFAQAFARSGARVVLNGRNPESLGKAVEALRAEGCQAWGVPFDLGDSKAVAAGVARIEADVGGIDILVNNAGIQRRNPLETFPEEDFRNLIDINLISPFVLAKAVVPGMIRRKAGKIINICSLMSEVGRPGITPYAASKGGLKMLTRGMALEWAKHGIQVNGIGPGYFKTEMNQALVKDADFDRWICGRTPAGRWGEPEELIGALLFLSSPASSFVNGQILYVDGGILAAL